MKRAISFSLILLGFLAARSQADDAIGSASKDFEGTWLPLSAEFAGENYPDEILKTMKLILKDKNYTVTVGDHLDEGTWTIDPKKSPKAMDIIGTNGPNKGKTILTIYELEKDTLRVCYDLGGKERPTEFKTKANTKLFLVTYKRARP
jgi:uncharacterized protein (TIGR03067 family)